MTIQTVFNHSGHWELGEIEVHLLPGIPNLHVVGLPDTQIKECGIKLKSALKTCGFSWPKGNQIIVNLRPNHFRKTSAGVELAIALGFLLKTRQLPERVAEAVKGAVVYGEVALDGRVIAPHDLPLALRAAGDCPILTGVVGEEVREGLWSEMESLRVEQITRRQRFFDWNSFFKKPPTSSYRLHPLAARALVLSSHLQLHVLLAGPQGSGKSTWARILYSLSEPPDPGLFLEREETVGREELRWRPLEQPHHSTTPLAMVGGGYPIAPGVISRAHGGILLMDEFLEFSEEVLENLREPLETGRVEIARRGAKEVIPARFQLVATTNLCPCGKAVPGTRFNCPPYFSKRCKSVVRKLSGPLLDRFDLMIFSHDWVDRSERVSTEQIAEQLEKVRAFAKRRGEVPMEVPDWIEDLPLNHRRRASMLRVARGLADLAGEEIVESKHLNDAVDLCVSPILKLDEIFA